MKPPGKRLLVAVLLYYTGAVHVVALIKRALGFGGPVFLTGHRVLPASSAQCDAVDQMALLSGHAITPDELARRLAFMQRWLMPAADPGELRAGIPSRRVFYLTFDDGYRDIVAHALPVLDGIGIRAVIFLVADLVENPSASPWWDRWGAEELSLAPNRESAVTRYNQRCREAKRTFTGLGTDDLVDCGTRRYLMRAEVESLPVTFYVANHTRSHGNLTVLSAEAQSEHIDAGEEPLKRHPRRLPLLAFPFGCHDERLLERLRSSGRYSIAFATGGGARLDPLRAKRVNLNGASFPLFAAQCAGLLA